jgi:hypothetical protein
LSTFKKRTAVHSGLAIIGLILLAGTIVCGAIAPHVYYTLWLSIIAVPAASVLFNSVCKDQWVLEEVFSTCKDIKQENQKFLERNDYKHLDIDISDVTEKILYVPEVCLSRPECSIKCKMCGALRGMTEQPEILCAFPSSSCCDHLGFDSLILLVPSALALGLPLIRDVLNVNTQLAMDPHYTLMLDPALHYNNFKVGFFMRMFGAKHISDDTFTPD